MPIPEPHPPPAEVLTPLPEPPDFSRAAIDDPVTRKAAQEEFARLATVWSRRQQESLRLWEPLPSQEAFHASKCRVRLARGSNRSGKTTTACIELARAVTHSDPHRKYPKTGDVYIIGRDLKHLGVTIYPKLFKTEANTPFWMIRDKVTKLWRAYRPWDLEDAMRKHERRPAPPLIPSRFYEPKDVSWKNKRTDEIERVKLKTGWTIWFFSGKATPVQGAMADLVLLDEEIERPEWFREMNLRIVDRQGCIIWSFTPQAGTEQAYALSQQAEMDVMLPKEERGVEEFFMSMADNPHIAEADKKKVIAACENDDDLAVRVGGQFAAARQIIYPEWNVHIHGLELGKGIPENWTRFAVIDPGHQICAVLFGACPDPNEVKPEDYDLVLYDELYIPRCSAAVLGKQFEEKARGQRFREFIIDTRGSRVTEAGSGRTIFDQYKEEFQKRGITSDLTGSGFTWGSDLVTDGIERFRSYLRPRSNGKPRLRVLCRRDERMVLRPVVPAWEREITRYRYKRDAMTRLVTDTPEDRGLVHLMAASRYLVMAGPQFHRPKPRAAQDPRIIAFLEQRTRGQHKGKPRVTVFGPASGVTV